MKILSLSNQNKNFSILHVASLAFVILMSILAAGSLETEPRLDTSSSDAIVNSLEAMQESIENDPDSTVGEKVGFPMLVLGLILSAEAHVMKEGGLNRTQQQNDSLFTEYFKEYDGMNAREILKAFNEKKDDR
jgi:hypothetical protein